MTRPRRQPGHEGDSPLFRKAGKGDSPHTCPRRGWRGTALIGVMGFLVLMMLLWTAVLGNLSGYVRVAKATQLRQDNATGQKRALAWGLTLLETGEPPQNPYSCRVAPDADPNRIFVIKFQEGHPWQYTVTVRPAEAADASLPMAPATFDDGSGHGQDKPPKGKKSPPPPQPSRP
jgi:hypothetical protein